MKKVLIFLVMIIGSGGYAQQYSSSSNYSQYSGTQQQQGQSSTGQMPGRNGNVMNDCSHLSQQEQEFAQKLSTPHRTMFCRHFSVAQRVEAMTLVSSQVQSLSGKATSLSPDEAVEIVMKNAREGGSQSQKESSTIPGQTPSSSSYPSAGNSGKSRRNSSPYSNY